MPSTYTTLLGFVQPTTGELNNTWGGIVNTQLTQLVEDSIAKASTQSVTAGDWTLSTAGGGAANEARNAILVVTGTPGTTRNIYAPKKDKMYVVVNNSDSIVYVKGGPTSPTTGVQVKPTNAALVAWDTSISDFVLVAGGGAGATGGGTNEVFYENDQSVTVSYSISANKNAGTFGPVTVNAGITVTVPSGSVWTIV